MSFIYWEKTDDVNLEDYTLILPAIAVGNVGQLAVDLLINNLNVESIAYLHHACFLPFAGADAFNPESTKLSTSCQMYQCKEKKLVIIQHRSPLIKNKVKEYMDLLVKFIKDYKIKKAVMLSSSFSQYFTFEQLQNVPVHYLVSSTAEDELQLQKLAFKKFDLALPFIPAIPGGGITKNVLNKCDKESVPLVVLIKVCSEGDNYNEAFQVASCLNKYLLIKEENPEEEIKWETPFSWDYPYANDAPDDIY